MINLKEELKNTKKFDLNGYKIVREIGRGNYGRALLCEKDSKQIVVKEFFEVDDFSFLDLIKREIINQSEYSKDNLIVPFLGISFINLDGDPIDIPLLVIEYEEGGSLKDLDKKSLNDSQKMIIIYGIAKEIQYLHHAQICHRDLNPNNVLLNANKYPFICDFGTSRQISIVQVDEGTQRGTPLYMSPEMLTYDEITTEVLLPSDVFSFGLVVYNLLTNETPYKREIYDLNFIKLANFLNSGKRIKLPNSIPSWFRYLIELCWKQDPKDRPTMDDIVNLFDAGIVLQSIYTSDEQREAYFEYINSFLHIDIEKINVETLQSWHDRLVNNNKFELAMVVVFILADHFKNSFAQNQIGYSYFNGYVLKKDIKSAIKYFKEAAENGNPNSMFYLFEIYQYRLPEIDVYINETYANRYFQLAVEKEFKPAVDYSSKINDFSSVNKENSPKIVVVGDNNVGKTSFINHMLKNNPNPLLFPTNPIQDYYLPLVLDNGQKEFIHIVDTSDFETLQGGIQLVLKDSLLVIIIFDKTNAETFNNIDRYINLIKSQVKSEIIILGNKMDLANCSISYSEAKAKAKQIDAKYYDISALASTNIEMICDEIISYINKSFDETSQEQISIKHIQRGNSKIRTVIMGSSACGKTSFIKQLLHEPIGNVTPTLSAYGKDINLDLFTLNIIDTAGQEGFISLLSLFIRRQNLFIIMFDVSNPGSFADTDEFYNIINDSVASHNFRILLFGNKVDLDREVSYDEALAKARSMNAEYIEISCQNRYNFDLALQLIEFSYNLLNLNEDNQNKNIVDLNSENKEPRKKCCK